MWCLEFRRRYYLSFTRKLMKLSDAIFNNRISNITDKEGFHCRMPPCGMWRRVDLVWTDVSEERIVSIFRVEKSASEEPAWAGGCSLPISRHNTQNCRSIILIQGAPEISAFNMMLSKDCTSQKRKYRDEAEVYRNISPAQNFAVLVTFCVSFGSISGHA
jgi:hypothetical protein